MEWLGMLWVIPGALIPAYIAKKKGRNFGMWYVYGLLLWIVALIHSLCLEDHSGMQCPVCKEWIKEDASVCKHCHTVIADYYREHQGKTKKIGDDSPDKL